MNLHNYPQSTHQTLQLAKLQLYLRLCKHSARISRLTHSYEQIDQNSHLKRS